MDGNAIQTLFGNIFNLWVATYTDENNKEIDLLIVKLLRDTALDRARTMQRNFIAQYLEATNKNAALVAFVSPKCLTGDFLLLRQKQKLWN